MKAIVQERYGSPDVLELRDVDPPVVGDDQVLVRVRAASVHPDVWHVVSGRPYVLRFMGAGRAKPKNPIPGTDMAGTVESVGKSVTRFRPDDAVFGETIAGQQWVNGGAFAEYASVRQDLLALKPDNVTFEQAASVPTSGFIALQNLGSPREWWPGRKVLVNGAGGGVGALALQIAKAYGAHVTAVDGTGKLDMLRSLGADEVVDYRREDFTRRGASYDLIFDVPGNYPVSACRRALKPDGRYVLIGHERYGEAGKRVFGLIPRFLTLMVLSRFVKQLRGPDVPTPTKSEAIAVLRELLDAGEVVPVIDSVYALSEAREALRRMMEDGLRGKVIVTPWLTLRSEQAHGTPRPRRRWVGIFRTRPRTRASTPISNSTDLAGRGGPFMAAVRCGNSAGGSSRRAEMALAWCWGSKSWADRALVAPSTKKKMSLTVAMARG
jgi:NADPH:quinone reductase-like Zn-dependent oxidoreductase